MAIFLILNSFNSHLSTLNFYLSIRYEQEKNLFMPDGRHVAVGQHDCSGAVYLSLIKVSGRQ
jgi:hypothetical protein